MADIATQLFYATCNPAHREFYSALMHDWQEAGQPVEIDNHGAGLAVHSVAWTTDAGAPKLFRLYAGAGVDSPCIEIDLDQWRNWFGEAVVDICVCTINAIDGLSIRRHNSRIAILNPGHMSGPMQQALREALVSWAYRANDLFGA
ncbi:MAG: hypothetical protein Q9M24_03030 [Mariprofundaceae bacterium]|nr:hypothetical protein [Mariprofundaceae bacterium]